MFYLEQGELQALDWSGMRMRHAVLVKREGWRHECLVRTHRTRGRGESSLTALYIPLVNGG